MPTAKRRKPVKGDVMLSFRAPFDLVELLDAEVQRLSDERKGTNVARADVIREALYAALRRPR